MKVTTYIQDPLPIYFDLEEQEMRVIHTYADEDRICSACETVIAIGDHMTSTNDGFHWEHAVCPEKKEEEEE